MLTGLHHINLTIPASTFPQAATSFYAQTLGLTPRPVPSHQRSKLLWFDIGTSGQQVHIAIGAESDFAALTTGAGTSTTGAVPSSRHPCFRVAGAEELRALQERIWKHFEEGGVGAPCEADCPGGEGSGDKGVEYPMRFFARDFAGNRLEFSL